VTWKRQARVFADAGEIGIAEVPGCVVAPGAGPILFLRPYTCLPRLCLEVLDGQRFCVYCCGTL
jgi:hypothetical protein